MNMNIKGTQEGERDGEKGITEVDRKGKGKEKGERKWKGRRRGKVGRWDGRGKGGKRRKNNMLKRKRGGANAGGVDPQ